MNDCHEFVTSQLKKNILIDKKDYPSRKDLKNLYKLKSKDKAFKKKELGKVRNIDMTDAHLSILDCNSWLTTDITERFTRTIMAKSFNMPSEMLYVPSEKAHRIFIDGVHNEFDKKMMSNYIQEKVNFIFLLFFKILKSLF